MSLDHDKDERIAELQVALDSMSQINRQLTEHLDSLIKHPHHAALLLHDSAPFYALRKIECHQCGSTAAQAFRADIGGAGPRCDPKCQLIPEQPPASVLPAIDVNVYIKRLQLKKLSDCTIVVRFIRHSDRENIPANARNRFERQLAFVISKRSCIYAESEEQKPVIPGTGSVAIATEMFVKGGSALTSIVRNINPPRHRSSGFHGPQDMVRYLRIMLEQGFCSVSNTGHC